MLYELSLIHSTSLARNHKKSNKSIMSSYDYHMSSIICHHDVIHDVSVRNVRNALRPWHFPWPHGAWSRAPLLSRSLAIATWAKNDKTWQDTTRCDMTDMTHMTITVVLLCFQMRCNEDDNSTGSETLKALNISRSWLICAGMRTWQAALWLRCNHGDLCGC